MDNERPPTDKLKLATVDGQPTAPAKHKRPTRGTRRIPVTAKKHRKMRGQKGWNPTKRDLLTIQTCRAAGMTPEAIAAIIGVSPNTLKNRAHDAVTNGAATANSRVVSKLFEKCMKGDTIAMLFWCKTRLHWQERQRVEHTGADGGPIQHETVEAEANDFTARILAMAQRFEDTPPPSNDAAPAPASGEEQPAERSA